MVQFVKTGNFLLETVWAFMVFLDVILFHLNPSNFTDLLGPECKMYAKSFFFKLGNLFSQVYKTNGVYITYFITLWVHFPPKK